MGNIEPTLKDVLEAINTFASDTEQHLGRLEGKVDSLDQRLFNVEQRLGAVEFKVGVIESRVGVIELKVGVSESAMPTLVTKDYLDGRLAKMRMENSARYVALS